MSISPIIRSIVSDISDIHKDLGKLISSFQNSSGLLKEKMQILHTCAQKSDFSLLEKRFQKILLIEAKASKTEIKVDKKMLARVLKVIANKINKDDLQKFKSIDAELQSFITDVSEWKSVINAQQDFLNKNKGRWLVEHAYVMRYLGVLLDNEREIIDRHNPAKPGEKELIERLSRQINSIFEKWQPKFLGTLKWKEIKTSNDPDLVRAYDQVFKTCFPLDIMPLSDFKEMLDESNSGGLGLAKYHILIIMNKAGNIIAAESFHFMVAPGSGGRKPIAFGMDEYLAVLPEYRRFAIADSIMDYRLNVMKADAKNLNHILQLVVGEYHNEKHMTPEQIKKEGFNPIHRKRFWRKMGFRKLGFTYHNPSVDDLRVIERDVYNLGINPLKNIYEKRVPPLVLLQILTTIIQNNYGKGERGKREAYYSNIITYYRKLFSHMHQAGETVEVTDLLE